MDHIEGFRVMKEMVPYKVEDIYDRLGFFGYPDRKGWNKKELLNNGDYGKRKIEELESFLQSWLFFGLLTEVLPELNPDDFIRKSPLGESYITTEPLENYLGKWKENEKEDSRGRNRRMVKVELALDEARTLISKYCSVDKAGDKSYWPIDPLLSLSFMILGETLTHAKAEILGGPGISGWHDDIKGGWGNSKEVLQRMIDAGWCPHSVRMIQGLMKGHVSGLYYASTFDPPNRKDHRNCSDRKCIAEQADKATYLTKHEEPNCSCDMIGPNPKKLAAIIEKGDIPLLTYDEEKKQVDVSALEYHRRYLTFSHVWADGLGNPKANTLPICQLQFLNGVSKKLYDSRRPVPFWIDTLAVPIDGEARKQAISKMHDIYTRADKTVVLDAALRLARIGNNYETTAMMITISGWMKRLWTLQEGVLSKNLYFKFCDKMVEVEELEAIFPSTLKSSVPDAAQAYYHGLLRSEKSWRGNYSDLLASVWRAAQWRTTGHPEDETIAIATLLKIDPDPLLLVRDDLKKKSAGSWSEEDLDMRVEVLLSSLGDIGAILPGMIFLPGPRLRKKGFGWAPRTWMAGHRVDHPDPLSIPGSPANLLPRGLMVRYPGFKLHSLNEDALRPDWCSGEELLGQTIGASKEDNQMFWFPSNKLLLEWYLVKKDQNDCVDDPCQHVPGKMGLALIFPRSNHAATPEIAVLVAIREELNRILYVGILHRVWVSIETRQSCIDKLKNDFVEKKVQYTSCWGEILNPDQQWCVDGGGWADRTQASLLAPETEVRSKPIHTIDAEENKEKDTQTSLLTPETEVRSKPIHAIDAGENKENGTQASLLTPETEVRSKPIHTIDAEEDKEKKERPSKLRRMST
jgi:hypothetical protein